MTSNGNGAFHIEDETIDTVIEMKEIGSSSPPSEKKSSKKKKKDKDKNKSREAVEDEEKYYGNIRLSKPDPHADDDETIVSMKNVHKTYLLGVEGVPALRGVSMTIKRGEFVCIFGTSGGGKTTMLNIMGTIDKPTKGELKLCGNRITNSTKDSLLSSVRLTKIGFVFQTFNLLSALTAQENVEMPMVLNGVLSQADRRTRAKELLTLVGMAPRLNHVPSQLSGGEQQRVTIARAIANNPELLLLDEPTGDLDTVNTHIVMKLLTELNQKQNITMVMVTHDVALKNYADRVIWMRDGKIQRVEDINPAKKEETLKNLDDELAAIKKRKKKKKKGTFTEYRIPTDYTTSPLFVKRDVPIVKSEEDKEKAEDAEKDENLDHMVEDNKL